jgi:succinyl-CoA synthetase alpha subunit
MPILVDQKTRLIFQGPSHEKVLFHVQQCLGYGTHIVAGVIPGKGGQRALGLPVFDSVIDAKKQTECDATLIFFSRETALDAILEAIDANLSLIIATGEDIPLHDMLKVKRAIKLSSKTRLIGPSSCGVITPVCCKAGTMPGYGFSQGPVGIVSRSNTLLNEIAWDLTQKEIGQSTCVSLGRDPVRGTSLLDVLLLFERDPQTEVILMIGESGNDEEEEALLWIKREGTKPVVAFLVNYVLPEEAPPKHIDFVLRGIEKGHEKKRKASMMEGVIMVQSPGMIASSIEEALQSGTMKNS